MNTVTLPALQQWAPRDYLFGNSFGKAWEKQNSVLRFKDGGRLHVFTYEMDPDKFVGAQVDYVWFDEPPPEAIFNEASVRVIRRKGKLKMTLTPVNMSGGGIGYLYRRVYKQREHPDITVVRGSIHDNPHLPTEEVNRFLAAHKDDPDLAAREYGDFVHIGGMVYPNGFENVLTQREMTKDDVKGWDVVVGMDPGLKNAAFIWIGFDSENTAFVFDEVLLNEKTPDDYAKALHATNRKWGITSPTYVIDPSARNRSLVNAESVEANLQRLGIYPVHGQNQVEAGVQQVRSRMTHRRLWVSPKCRGLRDEAEEYRMQDRDDGEFKVVKENDHRLDALRYALMHRAWDPLMDDHTDSSLGWDPSTAPSSQQFSAAFANRPVETSPLGFMS